ncbi:MAG: RNA-guided endonuclease IscB [Promethearchaeota archaeon]
MMVYVLTTKGTPVMPCRPVIARLLLKQGKAKVTRRTPFTIKLNYELAKEHTQELYTGLDTGSGTFGAAVTNTQNEVLYLSQVQVRNDIKKKMVQRRQYRRTRRHRKCRYRPKRFDNRKTSRRKGRLAPTITSKLQAHVREVLAIKKVLPIALTRLTIEGGIFNSHAIKDPKVLTNNWLYQKGEMYGYENTKAYVRARDNHTCQLCKGRSKVRRLECHHLVSRSEGGTDIPTNLITLCEECHDQVHKGIKKLSSRTIKASITRNIHATQMNILRSQLMQRFPQAKETFGCITKIDRETLDLPKAHYYDATAIASQGKPITFKQSYVLVKKCVPDGDYQQRKGKRSEQLVPRTKIRGFKKYDKIRYQGQDYFIKGRMSTGYAILMDIHGNPKDLGHIPKMKEMQRVRARTSCIIAAEPRILENIPSLGEVSSRSPVQDRNSSTT